MSISLTGAPTMIWEDAAVSVRVFIDHGRFAIEYPLKTGNAGIPDFTTRADAISYAEHVAKTIRFQRKLSHETALKEEARRAASRTATIDLVLQDREGDLWVSVGGGFYTLPGPGPDYSREYIENRFGPVTVERSITIRGEVVA
jgi:hypothetical protein